MKVNNEFKSIAVRFRFNILALEVFNNEIGALADAHDDDVFSQLMVAADALVPDQSPSQGDEATTEAEDKDSAPTAEESGSPENTGQETTLVTVSTMKPPDKERSKVIRPAVDVKLNAARTVLSVLKRAPLQGVLLRRGAITVLVSFFESLISDLIQAYYSRYPRALPCEEHLLSLADLRMLGSTDAAERHLMAKEADTVLRKSTPDQLDYFAKRLNVDLKPLQSHLEYLNEITQRRNLLVHNAGVVNQSYLGLVPQPYIEANGIKEGEQISVSKQYLTEALNTIYMVGVVLIQQCWRKWVKEAQDLAEEDLFEQIYETLEDQKPKLTLGLGEYANRVGLSDDNKRRIVAINQAIALKELGKKDEMEKLLSALDWSSAALKFHVALHVLRDEQDDMYRLLPKAIAAEEISATNLQEWPLFRQLRSSSEFSEVIRRLMPPMGASTLASTRERTVETN